jgi:hypothetical protein
VRPTLLQHRVDLLGHYGTNGMYRIMPIKPFRLKTSQLPPAEPVA